MADRSLVMTFLNQQGTRTTLSLPGVREDITEQEVSIVMDGVVARNIFNSTGGDLIAKHSAQVNERQVTDLAVR